MIQPVRDHIEKDFPLNKLQNLRSKEVPPGWMYLLQVISWELSVALSGGNTRARLCIERQGSQYPIQTQATPTVNQLYPYTDQVNLFPGDNLLLELDNAGTNTHAKMYWIGIAQPIEEVKIS